MKYVDRIHFSLKILIIIHLDLNSEIVKLTI